MIVSRTPLRITLGGGGTDLVHGSGYCVTATIDKYVTVAINDPHTDDYIIRYSETERVKDCLDIQHPIIRRVLSTTAIPPGIEITTMGDLPGGTGLGSSGAFTVGLLRALHPHVSRPHLTRLACTLDTGQQDQWSAVYGGIHAYDFAASTLRPIHTTLTDSLQLFYTGTARSSAPVPVDPTQARVQADAAIAALEGNDPELLGACLFDQWSAKVRVQPSPFHTSMTRVILSAMELGAYGGKLVGAGNGGFLLFAGKVDPIPMRRMGLVEIPFSVTYEGSTIL